MKQDRDQVIALLKADLKALEGFVNSRPRRRFEEDRFEHVLIDHLILALNLLESDTKADVYRDEVIFWLKSDVNALEGFVNSIPYRQCEKDRLEYILIDHLTLELDLLESDKKTDVCKDCLVNEDK